MWDCRAGMSAVGCGEPIGDLAGVRVGVPDALEAVVAMAAAVSLLLRFGEEGVAATARADARSARRVSTAGQSALISSHLIYGQHRHISPYLHKYIRVFGGMRTLGDEGDVGLFAGVPIRERVQQVAPPATTARRHSQLASHYCCYLE